MENKSIRINRQYKDRLFRLLFGSYEMRENIISLYNALNGTDYPPDKEFEISTLDDAVYINVEVQP